MNVDKKLFDTVKLISHDTGIFYTVMNDYLDCYDSESCINKPGSDIEFGKFSWLAVMAMEHGTDQQKDTMMKFYGKSGKIIVELNSNCLYF